MVRKGSFTVEAACVMPVILLALMGSLYLCFFVHNRAWLTAAAYEAALAGSMEGIKRDGMVYETARMRCEELGNTGFFGVEDLSTEVHTGKKVQVAYQLHTMTGYGGIHWSTKAAGQSKIIYPVKWIRTIKSAGEIVWGEE